jgi:hypothetical protein
MMKKIVLLLIVGLLCADEVMEQTMARYENYIRQGTYNGEDVSRWYGRIPESRYETFFFALKHFIASKGKVVVELGTTRSFVHGGLVGCNSDDPVYWTPDQPQNWDWGAGCFTRVAAECLAHLKPQFHTIDIARSHIERCKRITHPFASFMNYHVCSSEQFLRGCQFPEGIDLLYLDTGDMTPIEPTAQLQLAEAKIICERNLISKNGLIIIDDVRNVTPKQFGESSNLGKAKYSIPYFLEHGFEIVVDEYQVILQKR